MSVIKKKPEIEVILSRLNATQLSAVLTAVNSTTPESFKSLINPSYGFVAVNADNPSDIASYQVQLDAQKVRNGICIRVYDSVAAKLYENLLVYGESQKVTIYELNTANDSYRLIEEYCDINELRRVINDVGGEESHPGVFTDLQVEGDLTVEGDTTLEGDVEIGLATGTMANTADVQIHGDAQIHGDLIIDNLQNITDPDGDPIIPDPTEHLREAIGHSSTGYAWYKGYELAGFQVVAKSVFEGEGYVPLTHTVYFVWNDTTGDHYGEVYVRYYEQ